MSKIFPLTAQLPSPYALKRELQATLSQKHFIAQTHHEIQQILSGKDPRIILIVGPCSIHDIAAAKEYASRLCQLKEDVSDTFMVIMRVYFEKARTQLGWKGLLYDPYLDGSHDIETGMRWTRQLLLDLTDMQIPAATEFLDPASMHYFGDLISWGCIGARTSESQIHRQMASGLPMPVGFKNSTDGNVDIPINALVAANSSHSYFGMNERGQTSLIRTTGNPNGHVVLRGGANGPNYDPDSVKDTLVRLQQAGLPLRLFIDCSHDNACQNHENQIKVFRDVIQQIHGGNQTIRGILLESHLFSGNQSMSSKLRFGVSITDPCLDWNSTQELIRWAKRELEERKKKKEEKPSPLLATLAR